MNLVVFAAATWLSVFGFYSMRKSLSVMENTFIYLVALIIHINISWILVQELKFITTANNGLGYTAYLLLRSILVPMLYVIVFNLIYRKRSVAYGIGCAVICVLVLLGFNALALVYNVYYYNRWSLWYDAIYMAWVLILVYYLHRLFRMSLSREAKHA